MSRRDPFMEIREWARGGPKPEVGSLALCDEKGFGAMHVLAEEEAISELGAAVFEKLAREALQGGASAHRAEFEIGNTPLHWSCWHPAPGCALALIGAGAPQCSNRVGESPEQIALRLMAPSMSRPSQRRAKLCMLVEILRSQRERGEIEQGSPLAIHHSCSARI